MAAVTDEDLEKIRDDNEKKRDKLLVAQAKQEEQVAARNREIEHLQLQAESTRLDAQLAAAQEAAKVSNTKDGAENVLAAARQELENAKAVAEAPPREPEPPLPGDALPGETNEQSGGNS